MFFKKSRRTIKNAAMLDLRRYTAVGLSEINAIENAAMIILPLDAPPAFYDAFSKIELKNVSNMLKLSSEATVNTFNGCGELTRATTRDGYVYIFNGFALIHDLPGDVCPKIIANGTVVLQKGVSADILQCNGAALTAEFDEVKLYSNTVEITADYLSLVSDITIVAGNKIILDDSVSKELLTEKNIRFIAGNKIICPKAIYGFVTAISTAGNKVETS